MKSLQKCCVIYNMAAKYRAPIFKLMDKEMDVNWYYGNQIEDIREMDPAELKRVNRVIRKNLGTSFYWQKGVPNLLNKHDTFIVLGDLFSLSTWALLLKKKFFFPQKKIYLWSHGWYGREGKIKRILKKLFFGLADGTFLYGNYAKDIAIQQGNNSEKLCVIHNSLDYENHLKIRQRISPTQTYKEHFHNSDPTILFIGRLTKIKRLDLVIEAAAILEKKGERLNIVFVGDGTDRERLEKLSKEKNVSVWFYGECYNDAQTAQLVYDADICVSPGNVGLTAIHSMTFGTPVITHSNFPNQMPEFEAINPGITGDFFSENDVNDLANKISHWLVEHPNRDFVRNACFSEIENGWTPKHQLNIIKNFIETNKNYSE